MTPPTIGHAAELEVGDVVTFKEAPSIHFAHDRDFQLRRSCGDGFWFMAPRLSNGEWSSVAYGFPIAGDLFGIAKVHRSSVGTIYEAGGEGA